MGLIDEGLLKVVAQMCVEVKLPSDFLSNLREEKDWSFIILTHAFLEALLTDAIVDTLHRDELSDIIRRLEMANVQTGKIRIAEQLGLIKTDGKKFLKQLSSLRNDLVHNVHNANVDLSVYIKSLDTNQRKEFVQSFSYFASEEDWHDHGQMVRELVLENTKHAIWLSTMHFTAIMRWAKEKGILETLSKAMKHDIESKNHES